MTTYKPLDYLADADLIQPGVKILWHDTTFKCDRKAVVVRRDDNEWCVWVNESSEHTPRGDILINECHIVAIEEGAVGCNRRENFKPMIPARVDNLPPVIAVATVKKEEVEEMNAPTKPQITADMVIAAYIKTWDEIEQKKKEYEESVEKLKAVQAKREQWLTAEMDKLGLSNFSKKGIGTAFFKTKSSATMADVTVFTDWVMADWEGRQHFMDKRVSKTAVDQAVADGETPPPGTSYSTARIIQINRNKG